MRPRLFSRSLVVLPAMLSMLFSVVLSGCDPVKLPNEMPGPPGCGLRDPSQTGPSLLSVAQQQVFRAQGMPNSLEPNEQGGKTWMYVRSAGSVFGETDTVDTFVFSSDGLLVSTRTETRRHVGK